LCDGLVFDQRADFLCAGGATNSRRRAPTLPSIWTFHPAPKAAEQPEKTISLLLRAYVLRIRTEFAQLTGTIPCLAGDILSDKEHTTFSNCR